MKRCSSAWSFGKSIRQDKSNEKLTPAPNYYFKGNINLLDNSKKFKFTKDVPGKHCLYDGSNQQIPCQAIFGSQQRDYSKLILGAV